MAYTFNDPYNGSDRKVLLLSDQTIDLDDIPDLESIFRDPYGAWSDGTTLWLGHNATSQGSPYDRVFSFNLPAPPDNSLIALDVQPTGIKRFHRPFTQYFVAVDPDVAEATITPTAANDAATIEIDGTRVSSGSSHTVSLSAGFNDVAIVVTAPGGTETKTYRVLIGRGSTEPGAWKASDDFDTLRVTENIFPYGAWSDGTTMWISDAADRTLFAYSLDSGEPQSDKDLELDTGNSLPTALWSDGTTSGSPTVWT